MRNRRKFLTLATGVGVAAAAQFGLPNSAAAQSPPAAGPGSGPPEGGPPAGGPPAGGPPAGGPRAGGPRAGGPPGGGPAPAFNEHTEFVLSTSSNPYELFDRWVQDAKDAGEANINNMTLATVDAAGLPDARMMVHQEVRDGSFLYTSFSNSRKGQQLKAHPKATLLFYWPKIGRQVRVRGTTRQLSEAENDALWKQRRAGRANRLRDVAWTQSEVFQSAEELEQKLAEADKRYPGDIPRRSWTGWLTTPISMEFFYPHPRTTLHERIRFSRRNVKQAWRGDRLVP